MAWLRTSDDAATYPAFLRIDEHPSWDERLKCEMFGFLSQCATLGAQHYTDYTISLGTARLVAGGRAEELLQIASDCELVTPVTIDGRQQWKLLDDPNWIHMVSKEEKTRNDQRKKDLSDAAVIVPVRVRDGDQCRYCGIVVNWRDRKGGRGGTYDHRNGIDGNAAPDNVVVSCRSCNSERADDPDADQRVPLLEAPAEPYYSKGSAEWINDNFWAQSHGIKVEPADPKHKPEPHGRQRPDNQSDNAPAQEAPGIAHISDSDRTAPRTLSAAHADLTDRSRSWQIDQGAKSGSAGSGQVGSGRDGSRLDLGGASGADRVRTVTRRRSRGRRGRRGGRGGSRG